MNNIIISGSKKMHGTVNISGAKNAAVALLPAALLADSPSRLENVPDISDITYMCKLLESIGVRVKIISKHVLEIDPRGLFTASLGLEFARQMRASYYLLGAFLSKFNNAEVPMPGGCNFGVRPIDQHIKGFKSLGATCLLEDGLMKISCIKLTGSNIYLDVISVGATINIMISAVKAEGITVIENAAKEPHVVDVANFLNSMGADIMGAGTDIIKIKGVKYLHGTTYSVIPDQIEAGTYMVAACATQSSITIKNIIPKHLEAITAKLEEIGAHIICYDDAIKIEANNKPKGCNIKTMPYPGFPTDMQPQIVSLLAISDGTSIVNESVWDNRFRYVSELYTMGANISINDRVAVITGVKKLKGNKIKACDLRAGAALVIAGLSAEGITIIEDSDYIERGYENISTKFSSLGADIQLITSSEDKNISCIS
ncbi:MAG: UDP-N-acetylglucosamine 1-carboxyvinyltransferase [Candidatus Improbicoccus devescovinae]|nr:MAG: UDP-N-acetylglucosamine 1-carboxyvinyltransferase [Candidatus Improbicoccus devescovinae]